MFLINFPLPCKKIWHKSKLKDNKDSFTTIEKIFEAISFDKGSAGNILANSGIDSKKLTAAIMDLRKGKTATSESALLLSLASTLSMSSVLVWSTLDILSSTLDIFTGDFFV